MLQAIQVALNTRDISGSLRLYSDVFGFRNSGGQHIWGDIMRLQGLEPADRAAMWWMVGSQSFLQLEFFHHSSPIQRPLRRDWSPNDHGWVRIGISVPDFGACINRLADYQILPTIRPAIMGRTRRGAFRDPYCGVFVEIIEDRDAARTAEASALPALAYVASSVSDLASARAYYETVLGLQISPIEKLHDAEDEALWGLRGAKREGFVVESGAMVVEVVQYLEPVGRPRPSDWKISDQGIANVALGARDSGFIEALLSRLETAGHRPPMVVRFGEMVAAYVNDPEREIEFCAIPQSMDAVTGFTALQPFFGTPPLD